MLLINKARVPDFHVDTQISNLFRQVTEEKLFMVHLLERDSIDCDSVQFVK